jgi:hypothetical protein
MKNTVIGRILNFLGGCFVAFFNPILESIMDNTVVGKIVKGIYSAGQESGIIDTPGRLL